jgi:hypothetical protein
VKGGEPFNILLRIYYLLITALIIVLRAFFFFISCYPQFLAISFNNDTHQR